MANKNIIKLLIPSIFLLVLGIGNMIVGHYKFEQYSELMEELDKQVLEEPPKNLSPLQKLKYSNQYSPKLIALKNKAGARRDFYILVSFSGKVFLAISGIFFVFLFIKLYTSER